MKRITLPVVLGLLLLTLSCSNPVGGNGETTLIGKWGSAGVQSFEFTAGGDMIVGTPGVMITTYKYTASDGSGEYWSGSDPSVTVPFTYSFSGSQLVFSFDSTTFYLNRL